MSKSQVKLDTKSLLLLHFRVSKEVRKRRCFLIAEAITKTKYRFSGEYRP